VRERRRPRPPISAVAPIGALRCALDKVYSALCIPLCQEGRGAPSACDYDEALGSRHLKL